MQTYKYSYSLWEYSKRFHCSFEWPLTPHMTLSIKTCIRQTPSIKRTLQHSLRVSTQYRFHCNSKFVLKLQYWGTSLVLLDDSKYNKTVNWNTLFSTLGQLEQLINFDSRWSGILKLLWWKIWIITQDPITLWEWSIKSQTSLDFLRTQSDSGDCSVSHLRREGKRDFGWVRSMKGIQGRRDASPRPLWMVLHPNYFPFTSGRLDLDQLNACLKFKVGTTKYM